MTAWIPLPVDARPRRNPRRACRGVGSGGASKIGILRRRGIPGNRKRPCWWAAVPSGIKPRRNPWRSCRGKRPTENDWWPQGGRRAKGEGARGEGEGRKTSEYRVFVEVEGDASVWVQLQVRLEGGEGDRPVPKDLQMIPPGGWTRVELKGESCKPANWPEERRDRRYRREVSWEMKIVAGWRGFGATERFAFAGGAQEVEIENGGRYRILLQAAEPPLSAEEIDKVRRLRRDVVEGAAPMPPPLEGDSTAVRRMWKWITNQVGRDGDKEEAVGVVMDGARWLCYCDRSSSALEALTAHPHLPAISPGVSGSEVAAKIRQGESLTVVVYHRTLDSCAFGGGTSHVFKHMALLGRLGLVQSDPSLTGVHFQEGPGFASMSIGSEQIRGCKRREEALRGMVGKVLPAVAELLDGRREGDREFVTTSRVPPSFATIGGPRWRSVEMLIYSKPRCSSSEPLLLARLHRREIVASHGLLATTGCPVARGEDAAMGPKVRAVWEAVESSLKMGKVDSPVLHDHGMPDEVDLAWNGYAVPLYLP